MGRSRNSRSVPLWSCFLGNFKSRRARIPKTTCRRTIVPSVFMFFLRAKSARNNPLTGLSKNVLFSFKLLTSEEKWRVTELLIIESLFRNSLPSQKYILKCSKKRIYNALQNTTMSSRYFVRLVCSYIFLIKYRSFNEITFSLPQTLQSFNLYNELQKWSVMDITRLFLKTMTVRGIVAISFVAYKYTSYL